MEQKAIDTKGSRMDDTCFGDRESAPPTSDFIIGKSRHVFTGVTSFIGKVPRTHSANFCMSKNRVSFINTNNIVAVKIDELHNLYGTKVLLADGELLKFAKWCINEGKIKYRKLNWEIFWTDAQRILEHKKCCDNCSYKQVAEVRTDGKKYYFLCSTCEVPVHWKLVFDFAMAEGSTPGMYKGSWFICCDYITQLLYLRESMLKEKANDKALTASSE